MKPSTRLTSAVFQLTPTRTRCDLIIISNDKKEKLASGLLNPFLAHLKTAQDQIAKGGYSILLEPERGSDVAWFTKATMERFVRFVSTPEILERVYTIETEILQIQDEIAVQRSKDIGRNAVKDHQGKHAAGSEVCTGSKSMPSANEEKAIVLYQPGTQLPEANGSCSLEANSKVQLLKVLETRKTVLQKEQGMAFARAVAAGFDIDQMGPLVSFANCFGALRLMEACLKFKVLWNNKHETGQWLEIEAAEDFSTRSDFSAMNSSGIILSATQNKHDESNNELASENNGKTVPNNAASPVPNGQQGYYPGQFPPLGFAPWGMHAPPGAQQVFPAYPVQGMPYYQAYAGTGLFHQPVHNQMENSPSNFGHQSGHKRQSLDGRDCNNESEIREIDRERSLDEMEEHVVRSQPRKRAGRSNKKQSGVVVIRNVNYITSKEKKSGSESYTDSDSDSDTENEISKADGHDDVIHQNSKRSSNDKGSHVKSVKLNFNKEEVSNSGKDIDDGNWQAFQHCLLRGNAEDVNAKNDVFAMEKDVKTKRHANTVFDDPLALGAMESGEIQDTMSSDIHGISGTTYLRPRGSGDDYLWSKSDNVFRGDNDQTDIQFADTNGKHVLSRTSHEDFMIGSQHRHKNFRNSSDPLFVDTFEGATSKMDQEYSHGTNDEAFILPFRSMSIDESVRADRSAIDIDSEIPSAHQKFYHDSKRNKVNYEPDALILMPERGTEKVSNGNNLAMEYEMQVCTRGIQDKGKKDVNSVKEGLRKSDKDRRSKVISGSAHKQRAGGPVTKGKSSKMTPLEDARARAERLRSYKADLQKIKKEQEEAAAKRLEALKLERQKRIAAKGSSAAAFSPQSKQLPAKVSPATNRGSKFSDSMPGSSSPLQRSKIRSSPVSAELLKTSNVSKSKEGRPMLENRLTRSSSSLSETRRENRGVTPDSKASMARIRRLSEPKTISNPPTTLVKPHSGGAVSKRKLSDLPDKNKMSAIVNLDRSKAATLPELKIKTSKSHVTLPSTFCGDNELNVNNCNMVHHIDAYDNPIVDKTVVMLEYEKPSLSTLHSSKVKPEALIQPYDDCYAGKKSSVIPELASKHGMSSPNDGVDGDLKFCPLLKQSATDEVKTDYSGKETLTSITAEEPYRAPYARVSSLEDSCTLQSQYCKAPPTRSDLVSRVEETVAARAPDQKTLKKESSKGLRKLLKFGKKNPSSSVDQSVDLDCTSLDDTECSSDTRSVASTSEGNMLKNLILQDETSHAGKTSRHFSLFSPFRNKSSEKKQAS